MITEALVTVGGKGSRLRNAGISFPCSKSFIKVLGKPIIFWNLRVLKRAGFDRIVFCADSQEALDRARTEVGRFCEFSAAPSFLLDEGLGTAGLPFHFQHLFNHQFFFITGHAFVKPDHYTAMRVAAKRGDVTVSTYREHKFAKSVRSGSLASTLKSYKKAFRTSRMIDYPYVLDRNYCERLAANAFNDLATLRDFCKSDMINFVYSEMPVETDEPEQFHGNMTAIECAIKDLSLQ